MTVATARCRSAINVGWYPDVAKPPADAPGIHTRCWRAPHGDVVHEGKGLAQYDYQRFQWFSGDRRSYETDREDQAAWEIGLEE